MHDATSQQVSLADSEAQALDEYVDGLQGGQGSAKIPVHVSYEIIRLFSEGLYQSPQKAVEELVSNSYDAGASEAHVILPLVDSSSEEPTSPLWVIDDGHGLDEEGFFGLWRVAGSRKAQPGSAVKGRAPIGQFGIGKLAAYVLAWRLTHISSVDGAIRVTSMNFRRLQDIHQYDAASPLDLDLKSLTVDEAKRILSSIEERDPQAWALMFGPDAAPSWTAAGLTDFKDLYNKLSTGRLAWVLSSGLPLHSNFRIFLQGKEISSSKEDLEPLKLYKIGGAEDEVARELGLEVSDTGVLISGIAGEISGEARIYEKKLTEGKSDQYSRSNGFFIRVRGRVINLEDSLFGLPALNHAAWSRFSMEIQADGLREHLLSSREGVRDSSAIQTLRRYLHLVFNVCRNAYADSVEKATRSLDVERLLNDEPSAFITEPLLEGVTKIVDANEESFYVGRPALEEGSSPRQWLRDFADESSAVPFERVLVEPTGVYDRAVRYMPESRILLVNSDHPFVEKLMATSKTDAPAKLFGSAEVFVDLLMQEHGFHRASIVDFLKERDRILRIAAGDEPSTASEVLRLLQSAITHETALERAVGLAFRVLGFEYERRGGNVPGADGVLYARLGKGGGEALSDYKLVYDSKQTNQPAVPADKINLDSLDDFRRKEKADYGFFIAVAYANQDDPEGKLGRLVSNAVRAGRRATLMRIEDVRRLVELHYRFGVTLTQLRGLFEKAHMVHEVKAWIDDLEREFSEQTPRVPLSRILLGLEDAKSDALATPNIHYVRALDNVLKEFPPERLIASLQAIETIIGSKWLEVAKSGEVHLHHTAHQIVVEVERNLRDLFGVDATERSNIK
ncbi:hypothetical protein GCM10009527_015440 [Actinomadura nitritigenes]|uniref:ATP-binding protein n=1 Tax=Actinomadura nitritigenes TaxID=134602 RepID=A0ABS3QSW7_9ACTN|nr:ATP-binding protein [Actinomadura nitritigenes]MBO2436910.1 ATP-binding protein [Actinomadura nitritigenes]